MQVFNLFFIPFIIVLLCPDTKREIPSLFGGLKPHHSCMLCWKLCRSMGAENMLPKLKCFSLIFWLVYWFSSRPNHSIAAASNYLSLCFARFNWGSFLKQRLRDRSVVCEGHVKTNSQHLMDEKWAMGPWIAKVVFNEIWSLSPVIQMQSRPQVTDIRWLLMICSW